MALYSSIIYILFIPHKTFFAVISSSWHCKLLQSIGLIKGKHYATGKIKIPTDFTCIHIYWGKREQYLKGKRRRREIARVKPLFQSRILPFFFFPLYLPFPLSTGIGNSWDIAYINSFGLQKSASIYSLLWSSMSPQTRPNWARIVRE